MRRATACSTKSRAAAPARSTRPARSARRRRKPRWHGSVRSRRIHLASRTLQRLATWLLAALAVPAPVRAQTLQPYVIVGDAIPVSLTGVAGEATRGRALVLNRTSTCILCHSGPFPEEKFQGDLAPDLSGSGGRWSEGQLRLRIVDASRLNPATIMPSYYRVDDRGGVGAAWRGKPILSAEQIEDIVAYLTALRQR